MEPRAFICLLHSARVLLSPGSQVASEPRKILETRKKFLEQTFTSGQKAEAEVQRLLRALVQVRQCADCWVLIDPIVERAFAIRLQLFMQKLWRCIKLYVMCSQLPLEVGRVDAEFLKSCEQSLSKFL
jgi:hypothetical protein